MKFALITFGFSTDADKDAAKGPNALLDTGLVEWLRETGHDVHGPFDVALSPTETVAYGCWNRIGFANARLAQLIGDASKIDAFPLLLESNCYAAIGALAGLQTCAGPTTRVGMVWIDAHGDCNTPETTLSGMLSGMPVAIAIGQCLHWLRERAGLKQPINPNDILMVCVRANDPLEQQLIDRLGICVASVSDIKSGRLQLRSEMDRLSANVDAIYVHFDIDALDPSELGSQRLTEPNGPTQEELAAALKMVMSYPKVRALGVSDLNPVQDPDGRAGRSVLAVVQGGVAGIPLGRGHTR